MASKKEEDNEALPECYHSLGMKSDDVQRMYQGLTDKIMKNRLDKFDIDPVIDVDAQQEAVESCINSMSLDIPPPIIDSIIQMTLSDTQLFIESKAKTISNVVAIDESVPMKICREISTFSGGFCWDGAFWCLSARRGVPLHKYAYMNRVVYWCGHQDVIYCKSDEFCYGNRYFVQIYVDHKDDEIWCGLVFKDLKNWGSYQREKNQIAYYGGRRRKTERVERTFMSNFADLAKLKYDKGNKASLKYEMAVIEESDLSSLYRWDMAYGLVHGRSTYMSDILPWYGSGDRIGILVDTHKGYVYFFKEDVLVWYVFDEEIMDKENKCKVFGCTDSYDDTLIYQRVLWDENREKDLQKQIAEIKEKVEAFESK